MKKILIVLITFLVAGQDGKSQALKANISDLKFMTGTWVTQHEWGDMEEYWGEPMGNNMVCSYRCVKDGKIIFYEFVVIEQTDSVPVMILRHFYPGSVAREDKEHPNYFPLVSVNGKKAVFYDRQSDATLTYELTGPDRLVTLLEKKDKDGKLQSTPFHYSRKKD